MDERTELFDATEAARRLGMTEEFVKIRARRGEIPSRLIGRYRRFTQADLDEYVDACKVGGDSGPRITRVTRGRRSA